MEEKYLPQLMAEKDSLDPSFTHALRLVNQGGAPPLGLRGGGRVGGASHLAGLGREESSRRSILQTQRRGALAYSEVSPLESLDLASRKVWLGLQPDVHQLW